MARAPPLAVVARSRVGGNTSGDHTAVIIIIITTLTGKEGSGIHCGNK